MKKLVTILALVLCCALVLTACGQTGGEKPAEGGSDAPIKIGVVTTLSGSNSGHGEYCKEGVELWKNEVNANGGILGRQVEIVYEDNGETDQEYMNACIKMLTEDDVCAFYSNGYSSQVTLVLPEVNNYKIPFLAGNSSQACLDEGVEYYWMLRLSDAIVSPTMANACADLGMTKVAILQVNDSYGDGMADYVESSLKDLGVEVATRITVDAEETQFNAYLAQILDAGVDGLVAINHQDQAALVMMQVDAMGFDVPLMGCSQFASSLAIDTAGETADGWYSLADWTVQVDTESGKKFVEDYRAAYNRDPDMQSVCGHDAMLILQDAIERAGSDDPAAINEALKGTNGVVGAMTTYTSDQSDATGHNDLGQSIFLVQTQDGEGKLFGITNR